MTTIPTPKRQNILLFKENVLRSRGREVQKENIAVAKLVAGILRTSLGPRGMDKMLVDTYGDITVTSDGATMLMEMDVEHPAAKMMVDVAKATDDEVGDGTTSVVVLAGALLSKAEELVEKDIHPTIIIDGFKKASQKAIETLNELSLKPKRGRKIWFRKVAATSMGSKLVASDREFLAKIAVDAVSAVKQKVGKKMHVDIDYIKIKKIPGGSMSDTMLIRGIVLDKEIAHPDMPKRVDNAKILLLDTPLEIEKTEFDARINITSPDQIKQFLNHENLMLKEMVDKIVATGANVVICQKAMDDVATYYLAKQAIVALRRVSLFDMEKLAKATGAKLVTNVENTSEEDLGYAALVEERKVEQKKLTFIEGCKNPRSVTILIRGGSARIVDEAERSLHDALSVVKDVMLKPAIVAGGGAPETEVALRIEKWADELIGREQLIVRAFAKALLEAIPMTLAENAGLDTIEIEAELRKRHKAGETWAGVDVCNGKVDDMLKAGVVEPLAVKEQVLKSAVETASMILRIDDVIAALKVQETKTPAQQVAEEK
jgi:thermosome